MRILAAALLLTALVSGCVTCNNGRCWTEADKVGPASWSSEGIQVTVVSYHVDGNGTSVTLDVLTKASRASISDTLQVEGKNNTHVLARATSSTALAYGTTTLRFTSKARSIAAPTGLLTGYSYHSTGGKAQSAQFHMNTIGVALPP